MQNLRTVITGTGRVIPNEIVKNQDFLQHEFYGQNHLKIESTNATIAEKLQAITGIEERRYASQSQLTSHLAAQAAQKALEDAGTDPETIDQIIVAHNFGDIHSESHQTNMVPSLAARVRHQLGIKNPQCVPYDLIFGCPGWLQGIIHADSFIKSGVAKKCLVIGAETLSRVTDPHDRDVMIFADGAGACVVEAREGEQGVIAHRTVSHTAEELDYLYMGHSYKLNGNAHRLYIKMQGRKIYEYALTHVPQAVKDCLDQAGIHLNKVNKFFIHQANQKMDEAIASRIFRLYKLREVPENIMPMSIQKLGNSSVATIPTLLDLVRKNEMPEHSLNKGDIIVMASVGAGMNINVAVYRY
jgi:3-oxoacyl-[acyl-carrier-protein] synthase III